MPTLAAAIPPLTAHQITNFWRKVDKTPGLGPEGDCWEWRGSIDKDGYGRYNIYRPGKGTKNFAAHRVSWHLTKGVIPRHKLICHTCDHRLCVRPTHFFLGSHADNLADMRAKKRHAHGESHKLARLTEKQVIEIRERFARNPHMGQALLGAEYGVNATRVCAITTGRQWKHVGGPRTPVGQRRGPTHASKLTPAQVIEIRKLRRDQPNLSCRAIGLLFGISHQQVYGILTLRSWAWLKG